MMFGFGNKNKVRDKVVAQISQNLQYQFGMYIRFGRLVEVIQSEPYVAGYLQGKLISMISYMHHVEGLPEDMFNMVSGMVLINLFGEEKVVVVSNTLKAFAKNPPGDFLRGAQRGGQCVRYLAGLDDIREDPDYAEALRHHRRSEKEVQGFIDSPPSLDAFAALVGLEQFWIGDLLQEIAM
jgi:hypothetical protein